MKTTSRRGILLAAGWVIIFFLLAPSLIVFPISLTDTSYLGLPEHGLSLQHWHTVVTNRVWRSGFMQSLVIALSASAVATAAGTLCAIGCWRLSSRFGEFVRVLMLAPLIVPQIVYALGLYRFYASLHLLDTYAGVIAAHAAIGLPFVVLTVSAALVNFDVRLERAARNLGATPMQSLRRVLIPNINAGIISGAVFAFIASWDELIIVLFIASRKIRTLPRAIWSGVNESLDPAIAAVAVILIIVTVLVLSISLLSGRRQTARNPN
ncbi:ABC transporter membrane protein [Caballeronia udeis]|uniref:ABC transporter membrane protein n=1 Tax=Caballeronia udeis TaxID=1232866 RepID=A0A158FJE7_9BURK|nr:ABC transporter permease [Caballeronia udeis]SAL20036.1 ABC transporter membrane protein [Caballeronia udeis]